MPLITAVCNLIYIIIIDIFEPMCVYVVSAVIPCFVGLGLNSIIDMDVSYGLESTLSLQVSVKLAPLVNKKQADHEMVNQTANFF